MADAILKQVLDGVRTTIAALSLSGVSSSAIVVRKTPYDDTFIHSGITISWNADQASPSDSRPTNVRDMIGHRVTVTIVEGTSKGSTDRLNDIADRRQKIFRAFNNQHLTIAGDTDVNEVICKAQFGQPTVPKQYRDNYDVSQLEVTCWTLEPRS